MEISDDINCLPFFWTYMIKEDETKKSRCVCNGSHRMKGTVTLGQKYVTSLDQTYAKIFWALNAAKGNVVVGVDASNPFVQSPPPQCSSTLISTCTFTPDGNHYIEIPSLIDME